MKIVGTVLMIGALSFTGWWVLGERRFKGWALTIGLATLLVGAFLVLNERVTEFTIPKVGTIKAAVEKAQADAQAVNDLRRQIESQAAAVGELRTATGQAAERIARAIEYVSNLESELAETRRRLATIDKRVGELPPPPGPPRLEYVSSSFLKTESGLSGRVVFRSTSNAALSSIEFIVSIVGKSTARIESIGPAASVSLMVTTAISKDGQQARVRYTLLSANPPGFHIMLSAPAMLRVEGNPGVRPFEIKAVASAP